MAEILWGPYQEHHIAVRHGVTAELFEAVWVERIDLVVRQDGSYDSVGATDDGREVYLVWRWDVFDPERVFLHHRLLPARRRLAMPIRYITEDTQSEEQTRTDDQVRDEVERTGGVWANMSAEQRALIRARLQDKEQRAQAVRARKQAEQNSRRTCRWSRGAASAAKRLTDYARLTCSCVAAPGGRGRSSIDWTRQATRLAAPRSGAARVVAPRHPPASRIATTGLSSAIAER